MTQCLHVTIKRDITLTHWSKAVKIMIEKDVGTPRITQLRIIHLFDADFNFFLKLIWGSQLVKRTVHLDLLNNGQHGSIPRRTATDPNTITPDLTTTHAHAMTV
jgi:hypothetical protein